jgi:hypothetical protein
MAAIAGDFDLVFRVFAALAAIFLAISDHAAAGRMGTFFRFIGSHINSPWELLFNRAKLPE